MGVSDEEFRKAFKPLQIPAHYSPADTDQDKIIFALAQLGEGNSLDVAAKLTALDAAMDAYKYNIIAESVLNQLFETGLINGSDINGVMTYNLSKITEANEGAVNPDLLAPGLD